MISEKEIRERLPNMPVLCIQMNCKKSMMIKDAIYGGQPTDWYCSMDCYKQDKRDYPNG